MTRVLWIMYFWLAVAVASSDKVKRHIVQRMPSYSNNLAREDHPLCAVGDVTAACLTSQQCSLERGRFVGYCEDQVLECCFVEKTCDGESSSQSVTFKNPAYPHYDTEPRLCPLKIKVKRGVCAARVDFHSLELAKYEDGVCVQDTLTILGAKDGVATPVCGNMTGFTTTFEVDGKRRIDLALVAQTKYKFSITVTQLDCEDVPEFVSPTYAGIRNDDAKKYVPPPTEKPPKEKKKPSIAIDRVAGNETEDTTVEPVEESTSSPDEEQDSDEEEDTTEKEGTKKEEEEEGRQTTLKVGKFPSRSSTVPTIIIAAPSTDEDDGIYEEAIDVTPAISYFKKAFELRVEDKCWLYEEEEREASTFRIIGGFQANINEFPWQVALVYRKKFFCGGSLISDRYVLTAGHCVAGSFKRGIHLVQVSLGDHDLTTKDDVENVAMGVKRVIWHLNYSPNTNINDIAIFELERPVEFSYGVSAVRLPQDTDDDFEGMEATVTGWGRYSIKAGKKVSPVLKEFTAPVYNSTKCSKKWEKFPNIQAYEDAHVCMDIKMGTPCHGDSGGPLVLCNGPQCTQIGVVSFGFPLCTNVGLPAVFSRITHFRPWINRSLAPLKARPISGARLV